MNILITGSLGFIATNLALHLSAKGHILYGIDSLVSGSKNFKITSSQVKHFILDINSADSISEIFLTCEIDLVIHLAAFGNVVESIAEPLVNYSNNLNSTIFLLEAMKKYNVKYMIFSSTGGALMGRNSQLPINELSIPEPISPYGASKLACEGYISAYSECYGISSIVLRFGNVYGPHSLHKKGVINKWAHLMLENQDIVIFGDGSSTRDYISVHDICKGIDSAVFALNNNTLKSKFEIFHLANNEQVTLIQLYTKLKKLTNSTSNLIYLPSRSGEVYENCAEYSKATDLLGFMPSHNFEDSLAELLDWINLQKQLIN